LACLEVRGRKQQEIVLNSGGQGGGSTKVELVAIAAALTAFIPSGAIAAFVIMQARLVVVVVGW